MRFTCACMHVCTPMHSATSQHVELFGANDRPPACLGVLYASTLSASARTHARVHTRKRTYSRTHMHTVVRAPLTRKFSHTRAHACTQARKHMHTNTCTQTHARKRMHACMHACMHVRTHAHTNTCMHACKHSGARMRRSHSDVDGGLAGFHFVLASKNAAVAAANPQPSRRQTITSHVCATARLHARARIHLSERVCLFTCPKRTHMHPFTLQGQVLATYCTLAF